jgi:hypothetical protein
MSIISIRASLLAVALALAAPAHAGLSQDFSECDGLRKPKTSDDGMRGQATFPAYRFGNQDSPHLTLAACNRVLESGKLLPEQTLRRAHIMRARAAAKLQLGDSAGALADLDAAEAAGKQYANDFSYERSMGISINLLRAVALSEKGEKAAAIALAEAAATKRPYALQLQWAATTLRSANGDNPNDPAIWRDLLRIDPSARTSYAEMAMKPDDFAAIAAKAGIPQVTLPVIEGNLMNLANTNSIVSMAAELDAPVNRAMQTAYALAANGKADAAREWVAAARNAVEPAAPAADPASEKERAKKPAGLGSFLLPIIKRSSFDPMVPLVDARIAVSEARLTDAHALVKDSKLRSNATTEELYAAYAAARQKGGDAAPELPKLEPANARGPAQLTGLAKQLLIAPESRNKQIDYEKSRPNILGALVGAAFSMGTSLLGGVERTAGFRSTPNADGSIKVEYTGNTTSGPVVQEMTLLRAAELAREASKSHFQIAGRSDYQRYLTMTQYGVEMERTLVGYMTELNVRFLGAEEQDANALDAAAVIEALGPIYYGSSEAKNNTKKSS